MLLSDFQCWSCNKYNTVSFKGFIATRFVRNCEIHFSLQLINTRNNYPPSNLCYSQNIAAQFSRHFTNKGACSYAHMYCKYNNLCMISLCLPGASIVISSHWSLSIWSISLSTFSRYKFSDETTDYWPTLVGAFIVGADKQTIIKKIIKCTLYNIK